MKFETAASVLDGIPYTTTARGRFFYDFIMKHKPKNVLELGFAHGVSTCYFAAALEEYGGHIDTVDLKREFNPDLEMLSEKLNLTKTITAHRELSSYTWFLKKKIEEQTKDDHCTPLYDFCFIDGPKDWTNDGCAFFLADKLLKDNGWIIFDDYSWTYSSQNLDKGYIFPNLSEEEKTHPQIEAVFRLIVKQHPSYANFEIYNNSLAIAQKTSSGPRVMKVTTHVSPAYTIKKAIKGLLKR